MNAGVDEGRPLNSGLEEWARLRQSDAEQDPSPEEEQPDQCDALRQGYVSRTSLSLTSRIRDPQPMDQSEYWNR